MLLGALLLVCFATVPLTGGALGRLGGLGFRLPGLAFGALALQVLIIEVIPGAHRGAVEAAHVASYALLGWFLVANLRLPGVAVIAAGGLLNAIAITANGGVMPARPAAARLAGLDAPDGQFVNSGVVADPVLPWLGDAFAVPDGVPLANVFSVGDVLLLAGAAILLHVTCGTRLARWRSRTAVPGPGGSSAVPTPR